MSRSSGFDRQITIFSPEGRLYQIEYVFKAIRNVGASTVAIRGDDCVVIAVHKKVSDKLFDPSSITCFHRISEHVALAAVGMSADSLSIAADARSESAEFMYNYGYEMPVDLVAQRMADKAATKTQQTWMRPHGCAGLFFGIDIERGPALYRTDPAGTSVGYKACALGNKETELTAFLEKSLGEDATEPADLSLNGALKLAVAAMRDAIGNEVVVGDLEVMVVSGENAVPRMVGMEEMEGM
ncbi:Proteasome, subunit alpha/beta [Carpediemonas membranifera]|uniref:Proteasome, subunit alpha/beta n=1 Tax=Carpediemonas membranifera TaxID=201153 RepID=A0A8J6ATA7_9EUKA|nr:Proteasome, subunit alpha/beta [Carpediemonas membranifera]|eukprot:KAG9394021.1 Proteasome, subunit alpha/beta [Carpediemonas membranifera]